MNDITDKERCTRGCIWLGAGVGAAAFLMFWLIAAWGWLLSLTAGAILGGLAMFVFTLMFCGKIKTAAPDEMKPRPVGAAVPSGTEDPAVTATQTPNAAEPQADVAAASADPSADAEKTASGAGGAAATESTMTQDPTATAPVGGAASEPTAGSAAAPAAAANPAVIKPSKPLKGQQELAERKGSYKYEAPPAEPAVAKKAAPKKKAATALPDASDSGAPSADSAAKSSAVADIPGGDAQESKPETLSAARAEGPDDLKLISGVGPKLEQTLNELGFYHFDQVAKWGPQEIAWVDARLRFKGRIARDNWMAQAKTLAEGGETEFSARKKKT